MLTENIDVSKVIGSNFQRLGISYLLYITSTEFAWAYTQFILN